MIRVSANGINRYQIFEHRAGYALWNLGWNHDRTRPLYWEECGLFILRRNRDGLRSKGKKKSSKARNGA